LFLRPLPSALRAHSKRARSSPRPAVSRLREHSRGAAQRSVPSLCRAVQRTPRSPEIDGLGFARFRVCSFRACFLHSSILHFLVATSSELVSQSHPRPAERDYRPTAATGKMDAAMEPATDLSSAAPAFEPTPVMETAMEPEPKGLSLSLEDLMKKDGAAGKGNRARAGGSGALGPRAMIKKHISSNPGPGGGRGGRGGRGNFTADGRPRRVRDPPISIFSANALRQPLTLLPPATQPQGYSSSLTHTTLTPSCPSLRWPSLSHVSRH